MHTWWHGGHILLGGYYYLIETGIPFGVIIFWKADSIKHIKMTNTHGLRRESKLPGPEHEVPHECDPMTLPPTVPPSITPRRTVNCLPHEALAHHLQLILPLLRNHQVDLAPAALMPTLQ